MLVEKLEMLYYSGYPTHVQIPIILDLEILSQRCLRWITNEDHIDQETSIIALLTSQHLTTALQGHIDPTLVSTFQHFLLSTTLAHTSWHDHHPPPQRLSAHDLHRLSHLTGSTLLHQLDPSLRPGSPTDAPRPRPRPTLQALFLLVFGTSLGVACSTPAGSGPPWPEIRAHLLSKALAESPTLWVATRERLCRLLADDLVALAGALLFRFDAEAARENIIEGCLMGRWGRAGSWVWANAVLPPWHQQHQQRQWSTAAGAGPVGAAHRGPGGMFVLPTPQATMVPCPEALGPMLPSMDGSDGRKRRSMIVIGPSQDGQQMYARMRTHAGSDGPSLFV